MKKIALLLSVVLLFSVFAAACGDNSTTSSLSDDSSATSSENSEDNKIVGVNTNISVSDSPKATVISEGASYTCNVTPESYPDSYGAELTDGMRVFPESATYSDSSFVGYSLSDGTINIDIDLGYTCDKIYQFKVGYLASTQAGCAAPGGITARLSVDGKIWVNKGLLIQPEFVEGTVKEAVLTLKKYANARYVRFTMRASSAWMFIDEVQVIADVDGNGGGVAYVDAVTNAYQTLGAVSAPNNGNDINRDLVKTLISEGAKYTLSCKPLDMYKDNGKKLTDGILTGYYEGDTWVGFEGNQEVTAKVDLGRDIADIAAVEASFFVNTATKIYLPVAVKINAIDASNKSTTLGILYGNTVIGNGSYTFSLPLNKTIKARYIEFVFMSTDSKLHMVEELAVYSYREKTNIGLYPSIVIETDDGSWKSGQGSSYENLIAGKTQQILASSDPSKSNYEYNTVVTSKLMTDGKFAKDTGIHNNMFFKFNDGGGRKVIYDLENISAVDKFTASFTHQTEWAVNKPSKVLVFLSNNGKDWYEAGEIKLEGEADPALARGTLKLSRKVQARYVVFSFDVKGWCGCDELEVYGTKSSSGASTPSKSGLPKKYLFEGERIKPSEDVMNGAKDLCLLYHSHTTEGYDVESILPYVAYLDENGKAQDIMFDSILFLLQNSKVPSGGLPYKDSVMSDWQFVIDDLFKTDMNIMALESAVGQVKSELNLDKDYKYKVAVTLYYPNIDMKNFGDVDGDGVSEDFSVYNNRIKALKWFIDETEKRFNEQNFENIELVAYYWWHETIEKDDPESKQMLNDISDYVHKLDRDFIWIPYFTANGYSEWAEYGFDAAVMQPNYVFTAEAPYSNVENCANLTALYGMGLEMELFEDVLSKELFFKKYMEYIAGGVEFGYMDDCIIMYYQSVTTIRDAAYSSSTMARTVYDQTYHFIKGDIKYQPDVINNLSYTAEMNTPLTVDLKLDDKMRLFKTNIVPDHGSVTMNNDGTFNYYPETDYTGEVKFSFSYSEYLGWSDPCEVTITVK